MPVKRIVLDQLPEENEEKNARSNKIIFGLIFGILVLFAGNVVYESVSDVQNMFEISE
jgi:hypothetical protein